MIELAHISKIYALPSHTVSALRDINLRIDAGEFIALMGSSGSGKTTTMNIIGLLDKPSTGHYYLNGVEVSNLHGDRAAELRNTQMGFIFQLFFLLPRLTALQNVALPLTYRDMEHSEIERHALKALERVGLAEMADHKPSQLSGGQQQRVAIARAIVGQPKIILADEPTGSLDPTTGQHIMDLLLDINHHSKTTVIIVTHDKQVAKQCQRIIKIVDGRIVYE